MVIAYWAFIIFAAIQCRYVFYMFMRFFSLKDSAALPVQDRRPVSIIVCAKNEAANLQCNLPAILGQRYSNDAGVALYEVIVVNDWSDDDTKQVLQQLAAQYPQLKIVEAGYEQPTLKGKKHALSIGVAAAQHSWLLLTDADCAPAGNEWLALMMAPLAVGKEIVAGYGGYYSAGGLLNAFIRWETLHTYVQYSTYALAGRPYMAVGRNMACTRAALLKAQGSPVWNALPSGDDDLLVSVAGNATNTAVVSHAQAFTRSNAKATWREWVAQKQRHLSTGKFYKGDIKLSLAVYAGSHAGMWLLFLWLMAMRSNFIIPVLVYMAFRCAAYWLVWGVAARKLKEKKLIYFFPLFDIGWMVYNFAFFPYITWKNKKNWT